MSNNNRHHNQQPVFSRQSYLSNEQILPTSGLAANGKRTNNHHPARQTRIIPLDVDSDISRDSARLTADRIAERPHHPTHTYRRPATNFQTRPEAVPTHIRPLQSNRQRDPHRRQVVALIRFDTTRTGESRARVLRPDTVTHPQTSRSTNRGELPIDPDNSRKAFTHAKRPRGGVRQDKGVLTFDRRASRQPAPAQDSLRSLRTPTKNVCSRTKFVHKHKTVPLQIWIDPLLKEEVQRIAQNEALSASQVGATAVGEWIHQRLHDRHEALLYPAMRQLVRDENHALGNRLIFFQMRTAFAAEQTRILTTNLLNRYLKHQGVPDETFNSLIDKSNKMAKKNIIARTPELKSLMEEWWAYLPDDTENNNREENKHD